MFIVNVGIVKMYNFLLLRKKEKQNKCDENDYNYNFLHDGHLQKPANLA